jgi:uncharacterized membrane protein YsdA (DUF1294 family)
MREQGDRGTVRKGAWRPSGAALLFLGVLLIPPGLALVRITPEDFYPPLLGGLATVWGITLLLYWTDKRAAQSGAWRTPEILLHTCELLGGWPAAFLAQRVWRHKTIKLSYQVTFWLIVAAHQFLALELLLQGRISRGLWHEVRQLLH